MNLNEEVICDYLVTAKQKRINAVYLDLLTEFDRLCKQNGLTYWVIWGALLGAVRHKGFIPWDDDVDIGMPRPDFDRLRAMTSAEFGAEAPYFLQNNTSDPCYFQTLLRFRRSDTSCFQDYDIAYIQRMGGKKLYNMGLGLSIFPLSSYPKTKCFRRLQIQALLLCEGLEYANNRPKQAGRLRHAVASTIVGVVGLKNIDRFKHWLYRGWSTDGSTEIQCLNGLYPETSHYPPSVFAGTVHLPFEDISIPVPVGYEQYLRITYGDYMEFPPLEKRSPPHDCETDPDMPYVVNIPKFLEN